MERSKLLATPIPLRPSTTTIPALIRQSLALTFFLINIILIHSFQILSLILLIIPIPITIKFQQQCIRYSKESFCSLLVFMIYYFGQSKFLVTGSIDQLSNILRKDENGKVIGFKIEDQSVFISNHQQYTDWIYVWILLHLGNISGSLVIVLKASLRWLPLVGPAMRWFKFAFINKKLLLQNAGIVQNAVENLKNGTAFALLLFPEATLVSKFTRPKSIAFARASGIPDMKNTLLPRSTGLLWCLRSLLAVSPNLALYNLTIGYPYVPNLGYAQDYYTLTSTFGLGQAPPIVHIHFEKIELEKVPIGSYELQEEEKTIFQEWMINKWREKDELMNGFYARGEFIDWKNKEDCHNIERVEVDMVTSLLDYVRLVSIPLILVFGLMALKLLYSYWF